MAASDFFARWSAPGALPKALPAALSAPPVTTAAVDSMAVSCNAPPKILSCDDAAMLSFDSDFIPFMGRGVDDTVKRLALKRLFADPHFNIMDGLDTYIDDYNTFVPMSSIMVASLNHGKALLDPLGQLLQPLMTLVETVPAPANAPLLDATMPAPGIEGDVLQQMTATESTAFAPKTSPHPGIDDNSLPGL